MTVAAGGTVTVRTEQSSNGLPIIDGFSPQPRPKLITTAPAAAADPTIVTKTFTL